jgi:hypothetical protein
VKKIVLMFAVAFSVLLTATPVMAAPATKIPFTAEAGIGFGNVSPGTEWITPDGIYHFKGAVSTGNVSIHSALGDMVGTMRMVHDLALDLNTGLGDCHGKFVITVFGVVGTFEGSEHGTHTVTDQHYVSGGLVAHGTGVFAGFKMMASYTGEIITIDTRQVVVADMEGTLLAPRG